MLIAVLPMGIAYAKGVPFQGSIGWAVNVINGTDTAGGAYQPGGTDLRTGADIE